MDLIMNTTIFILHGPGHVRDITDQMRNGMMEALLQCQPCRVRQLAPLNKLIRL
ncbi:unnamed protein product [Spirodela intermedia]|uniref:Uncharacterized protein n=1 Tax=Spirodela intermedia TaxID=51605 RepID=A0A7I8I8Z4_SPIIN|nr:unnamed protein product [Spirodela intermedia]CAA6653903.1 unnamed protein product [Spirodela intermedia]